MNVALLNRCGVVNRLLGGSLLTAAEQSINHSSTICKRNTDIKNKKACKYFYYEHLFIIFAEETRNNSPNNKERWQEDLKDGGECLTHLQ